MMNFWWFARSVNHEVPLGASACPVDRPAFRRHPEAIIHGNGRGVYERQAVHGRV